ncbi:MAG: helix-turn-helix domain-containing protein [Rhodospirillaceae bacterium]|nr:helix-turn-helix domain-containing protein [Rhodospirillales bacterium]
MGVVTGRYDLYDKDCEQGRLLTVNFTTAHVQPPDRIGAWRQTIGVLFDTTPVSANTFSATMTAHHFGSFILCHSRVDGARYVRTTERTQWCDLDHYVIHVPLHQPVMFGSGLRVRPMDVGVLDLSCSADFVAASGEAITVLLPRSALSPLLKNPCHQHGRVLPRETPAGAVLAQHVMTLAREAPRLGMYEASAFSSATTGLAATCLGLGADSGTLTTVLGQQDFGHRLRVHLEQNLHRETLTPDSIIKDLSISRSQLYRQFERFGGVQHYIRQRRLRRCLLAICNPTLAGQRIADIAYNHGFTDEAHFSRLFRQTFGLSPRAARMAVQQGDDSVLAALVPQSPDASPFAHWVRELTVA